MRRLGAAVTVVVAVAEVEVAGVAGVAAGLVAAEAEGRPESDIR